MNENEKRELARYLAPHLAWDMSRSCLYRWQASETATGTRGAMFIEQVVAQIRAKIESGEGFTVAIIPEMK